MAPAIEPGGEPTEADFHDAIARRSDRWFAACLRITRNRGLAEDAVQEALLSAWHKRAQFRGAASLDGWIHRIAVNAALQLVRHERPDRFEPLDIELADETDSPERAVHDGDVGSALGAALPCLSDLERVCFVLKHVEQWRLAEIADELNASVGTVKQALVRAVKKLRARMQDMQSMPR